MLSSKLVLQWPGEHDQRGQERTSFPELTGILFGVAVSGALWAAAIAIFWLVFR
jgi:hypothetical protein